VTEVRTRIERRQSSRIRIFGDLHGRVIQLDVLVVLRDIGAGGFAIESPQMFHAGTELTIELTAPTGKQLVTRATVRQCVRQIDSEDCLPYLASFVFSGQARHLPSTPAAAGPSDPSAATGPTGLTGIEEFVAEFSILPFPSKPGVTVYTF
jgi:hypothetical protein